MHAIPRRLLLQPGWRPAPQTAHPFAAESFVRPAMPFKAGTISTLTPIYLRVGDFLIGDVDTGGLYGHPNIRY